MCFIYNELLQSAVIFNLWRFLTFEDHKGQGNIWNPLFINLHNRHDLSSLFMMIKLMIFWSFIVKPDTCNRILNQPNNISIVFLSMFTCYHYFKGQVTGKLYHLRLWVECTLFVIYKAGCEPTPYWWWACMSY
jgi:hypothetical protein